MQYRRIQAVLVACGGLAFANAALAAPAEPAAASAPAPQAKPAPAAARAPAPSAPSAPSARAALKSAQQGLEARDPASVHAALENLAKIGSAEAASAVEARLRRGLPPALCVAAIAALGQMHRPSSGAVLLELTLHRRPEVRREAIAALGALKQKSAQATLLRALDDSSPEVRAAAVQAIAAAGNAQAVPGLWRAADRGVEGAVAAIGALAGPKEASRLLERAAQTDVVAVKPALDAIFDRPNFPLEQKLALITRIEQLEQKGARAYLVTRAEAMKGGDPRLHQALVAAVKHVDQAIKAELAASHGAATTRTDHADASSKSTVAWARTPQPSAPAAGQGAQPEANR